MTKIVKYNLEDGSSILVEVEEIELEEGPELVGLREMKFEDALEKVKPAANVIIDKLRNLGDQPDEIEVEFGLKMTATGGALLALMASFGGEVNYNVKLRWLKVHKV